MESRSNVERPSLKLRIAFLVVPLLLSACASVGPGPIEQGERPAESIQQQAQAQDIVLYAMALMDTGYRFGGSAADIARRGHVVPLSQLRPGDLVFFNTLNKPYSHVGIYVGENRFAHAPSSGGKVRLDSIKTGWYASRITEARSYLISFP
jgi:cell wall-associated NlpC family hydrolase